MISIALASDLILLGSYIQSCDTIDGITPSLNRVESTAHVDPVKTMGAVKEGLKK